MHIWSLTRSHPCVTHTTIAEFYARWKPKTFLINSSSFLAVAGKGVQQTVRLRHSKPAWSGCYRQANELP